MVMSNPPHPGRSIREHCLDPLGLNVTEAAKVLGVARHTLSRVLNGHAAISRRWPFVLRRRAGPMPSSGCADRPLGISSRRARTKTGSTSSDTSRSRRCEEMQIAWCSGHVFADLGRENRWREQRTRRRIWMCLLVAGMMVGEAGTSGAGPGGFSSYVGSDTHDYGERIIQTLSHRVAKFYRHCFCH